MHARTVGTFTLTFCVYLVSNISVFASFSLSLPPQSQGSPYSMSGQRNVRALWANCKGEGRQNQVCVSQPVWYIQRKEPWNTKACWWVSQFCHVQAFIVITYIHCTGNLPFRLSTQGISFQHRLPVRLCLHSATFVWSLRVYSLFCRSATHSWIYPLAVWLKVPGCALFSPDTMYRNFDALVCCLPNSSGADFQYRKWMMCCISKLPVKRFCWCCSYYSGIKDIYYPHLLGLCNGKNLATLYTIKGLWFDKLQYIVKTGWHVAIFFNLILGKLS